VVDSGEFVYAKISTTSACGNYTATSSSANYFDSGSNTWDTLPSLVMYSAKTAVFVLYGEIGGNVFDGEISGTYLW